MHSQLGECYIHGSLTLAQGLRTVVVTYSVLNLGNLMRL